MPEKVHYILKNATKCGKSEIILYLGGNMLNTMLVIAGIFIALIAGYWMGFRACFDYLSEELEKYRKEVK